MPSMTATLDLNASSYEKALKRAATEAMRSGAIMQSALSGTAPNSTVAAAAAMRRQKAVAEYQESLERKAAGARLYREKQTEEQIEQARRDIRARRLRRERLEARMQGPDLDGSMRSSAGFMGYTGPGRARAWGGASAAMFVSVARDTSASLASGANPITVAMQQMPQMMQAFVMMGKEGFMSLKETLSSGLSSLWNKMGGGPGAGLAAAGAATAGWTIMEGIDALRAVLEENKNRQLTGEQQAKIIGELLQKAKQLYAEGKLSREKLMNIVSSAYSANGNDAVRKIIANLPKQGTWDEADLKKGSDYIRKLLIEAEQDPNRKKQMQAELERDQAMREVESLAKTSTIPAEEFVKAIEARYQAAISAPAKKRDLVQVQRQQMSLNALQQAGGYAAEPPGQRQIRDDLRAIRRVVEGATSDGGVKY